MELDHAFVLSKQHYDNQEIEGKCIFCNTNVLKRNWQRHLYLRKPYECGLLHDILKAYRHSVFNRDVLYCIWSFYKQK